MKFKLLIPVLLLSMFSCLQKQKHANKEQSRKEESTEGKYVTAQIAGWKDFKAEDVPVDQLTHINYAFGTVVDGRVVEHPGDEDTRGETLRKQMACPWAMDMPMRMTRVSARTTANTVNNHTMTQFVLTRR